MVLGHCGHWFTLIRPLARQTSRNWIIPYTDWSEGIGIARNWAMVDHVWHWSVILYPDWSCITTIGPEKCHPRQRLVNTTIGPATIGHPPPLVKTNGRKLVSSVAHRGSLTQVHTWKIHAERTINRNPTIIPHIILKVGWGYPSWSFSRHIATRINVSRNGKMSVSQCFPPRPNLNFGAKDPFLPPKFEIPRVQQGYLWTVCLVK